MFNQDQSLRECAVAAPRMRLGTRVASAVVLSLAAMLLLAATQARANIVMAGNTAGNPPTSPKDPCPVHHAPYHCWSELVPTAVTLINTPTTWFQNTLAAQYPGADWHFNFVGGNSNMNGSFNVDYYRAYNHCGEPNDNWLGAEIEVNFVPEPNSLIKDVLWIQGYRETWPGHDASEMDDRNHLLPADRPGALFGPFYPYQDEDEDDSGHWQTNYQYDFFYDRPGDRCPTPNTTTSLRFQTYACWWDDYFDSTGAIIDRGSPGHNVWIHEGFSWGYDLHCVPEPPTCLLLGFALVVLARRRVA